jgi:hypothetical protein
MLNLLHVECSELTKNRGPKVIRLLHLYFKNFCNKLECLPLARLSNLVLRSKHRSLPSTGVYERCFLGRLLLIIIFINYYIFKIILLN